jgi:hypothetical protein
MHTLPISTIFSVAAQTLQHSLLKLDFRTTYESSTTLASYLPWATVNGDYMDGSFSFIFMQDEILLALYSRHLHQRYHDPLKFGGHITKVYNLNLSDPDFFTTCCGLIREVANKQWQRLALLHGQQLPGLGPPWDFDAMCLHKI